MKESYSWGRRKLEGDFLMRGGLSVGVYRYFDCGLLVEIHVLNYCPMGHYHHIRLDRASAGRWLALDLMSGEDIALELMSLREAYKFACGLIAHLHYEECILPPKLAHVEAELVKLAIPHIYIHPFDHCGYCQRGEPHVHTN